MIKRLLLLIGMLWSAGLPASTIDAVPDFALIDHQGRFHQLSRYVDRQLVVLMMYSPDSPASRASLSEMASLQRRYDNAPVSFQVLVADPGESRASLSRLAQELNTELPFLLDESQLVTDALGFTHAGEVLAINPSSSQVVYRGDIGLYVGNPVQQALAASLPGMTSYLHYIVHSVLQGEPFIEEAMPVTGDPIELERLEQIRDRRLSYEEDVAPILIERCVSCHRDNGVAPWPMNSHGMVQGWSAMIRETLLTRRMPPGQIDPHYADRYDDVNYISDEEMTILMQWIEQGAMRAPDMKDPLANLDLPDSSWELGEPDLVIDFPEQQVPASGVLDYRFVPIELDLEEDKWVSAYEFDVGNKTSLHHIILYTQNARQRRQNASGGGSRTNFGGYAPGRKHILMDPDAGILLRRDMRLMVQFHYTTVGRELTDHSRLGLYFHDERPDQSLVRTAVMNGDFVIPAGARDYPVTARAVMQKDSYLYSFAPHMHYRGKHIRFKAVYPDGREESLLSIPNFQHNWQMVYRLKEPVFLPAGTEIVAEGGFDNSRFNPLNPNPEQSVVWGDQIWDEMFLTWMRISEVQ